MFLVTLEYFNVLFFLFLALMRVCDGKTILFATTRDKFIPTRIRFTIRKHTSAFVNVESGGL